jgi:hypothetical protein
LALASSRAWASSSAPRVSAGAASRRAFPSLFPLC